MFKNKKLQAICISLLASISLISVGFASWSIISASGEASGTISSENVLYTDRYVNATKSVPLSYCRYGFVDFNNKNNITNKGVLELTIDLMNLKEFKEKYKDVDKTYFDSLNVEINLMYEKNGTVPYLFNVSPNDNVLFDQGNFINTDPKFNINVNTISKNTSQYKTTMYIPLKGLLSQSTPVDKYSFKVRYTFTLGKNIDRTNFETTLLNTLKTKKLFAANININGYKGGI